MASWRGERSASPTPNFALARTRFGAAHCERLGRRALASDLIEAGDRDRREPPRSFASIAGKT